MNPVNPKKLLHSKWTAVSPLNREKHFMVTKVEYDESGAVEHTTLEAVHSRRAITIDWRALKNLAEWRQGWK